MITTYTGETQGKEFFLMDKPGNLQRERVMLQLDPKVNKAERGFPPIRSRSNEGRLREIELVCNVSNMG